MYAGMVLAAKFIEKEEDIHFNIKGVSKNCM